MAPIHLQHFDYPNYLLVDLLLMEYLVNLIVNKKLIIIVMGLINIHEFSFGKFFWTTVVTVLAMILIVFLVFMLAILLQQTKNFVQTIYLEAFFR